MQNILKLNTENLKLLPPAVAMPSYNRSRVKTGIVHLGIGSFHRSHQAYYTDQLLHHTGEEVWGICGISLLESDRKIVDILRSQDGLYTLMITEPDGSLRARVIGSLTEYLFAPENPGEAIEKMAESEIRIITLTITEGGYNFNASTGEFQINDPVIQWDLKNPENPKSVFGYLTQSLKLRKDRNIGGLTIQSCDNIQGNGNMLRKMLLSFVQEADPDLSGWIQKEVTFPNCMVDRITPVTTVTDIEKLASVYGIDDGWPVVSEPFIQWVVEDNYIKGRPAWESVGVQFVHDVEPFEKMKIRLLNAGHSLLGFLGTLYGCKTIDEAVNVPFIKSFLREFMDNEVTPVLGDVEGINIDNYKESLIRRFSNSNIKDQLSRICMESSAKIPKFLLPTINEQLTRGGSIKYGAVIVAVWCRYLELAGSPGCSFTIQDQMGTVLQESARASVSGDTLAFLKIEPVFGNLLHSDRFVETYLQAIDGIRKFGIERVITGRDIFEGKN